MGWSLSRFQGQAISVQSGGNAVTGNFIGTNASGNSALANAEGVIVQGTSNNTVGGATPGDRNLLSETPATRSGYGVPRTTWWKATI